MSMGYSRVRYGSSPFRQRSSRRWHCRSTRLEASASRTCEFHLMTVQQWRKDDGASTSIRGASSFRVLRRLSPPQARRSVAHVSTFSNCVPLWYTLTWYDPDCGSANGISTSSCPRPFDPTSSGGNWSNPSSGTEPAPHRPGSTAHRREDGSCTGVETTNETDVRWGSRTEGRKRTVPLACWSRVGARTPVRSCVAWKI